MSFSKGRSTWDVFKSWLYGECHVRCGTLNLKVLVGNGDIHLLYKIENDDQKLKW